MVSVVMASTVVALSLAHCHEERDDGSETAVAGGSDTPPYPDEWKTTLEEATSKASFPLVLPDVPLANGQNLTAVYLYPDRVAVAMLFPPSEPEKAVRQRFIEVWQGVWGGGDPLARFEMDIADDPEAGYVLLDLDEGITALGVNAHSPSDDDRANPAFLRFVLRGVDVQVSGGEDLDALVEVANSIIDAASAEAAA